MKPSYETFTNNLLHKGLTEDDLMDIDLAYAIAKHAHRHQHRKELGDDKKPLRYFEHSKRVAYSISSEAGIFNTTVICAALLHDGIEDTRIITYPKLRHWFGRDVAEIVRLLTKKPGKENEYHKTLIREGDWRVLVVKAADRLDNLRSLSAGTKEFQKKQIAETREVYLELFERLVLVSPPNVVNGAKCLVDKINIIVRNYEDEGILP